MKRIYVSEGKLLEFCEFKKAVILLVMNQLFSIY